MPHSRRAMRVPAIFVSVAVVALAMAAPVRASGLSVAFSGQVPMGSFQDVAGPGRGFLGGLELGPDYGTTLTLRSGYIRFGERDGVTRDMIPFLGGLRLSSYVSSVYLAAEGGWVVNLLRLQGDSDDAQKNTGGVGAGLGYALGNLDLRAMFHSWDVSRFSESMAFGISVGVAIRE